MNKLFTKIAGLSLGLAMAIGVGVGLGKSDQVKEASAATTYTMTIDSSASGNNNVHWTNSSVPSLSFNNVTWATSVVGTTSFTSSKTYCQIGSKSNPATKVTLISGDFENCKVTKVVVTCYCMSNTGPTLTVTAGSTTMINAKALVKTTSTDLSSADGTTAKLGSNENLTISFNSSASAAICISKIQVTYESVPVGYSVTYKAGSGTGNDYVVNDIPAGSYTLVDFDTTGFSSPKGQRFKCWSISSKEYNAGSTYTISGNTTVTALYEDLPTEPFITSDKTSTSGYTGLNETIGLSYGNLTGDLTASSSSAAIVTAQIQNDDDEGSAEVYLSFVSAGNATVSLKDGTNVLSTITVSVTKSAFTTFPAASASVQEGKTTTLSAALNSGGTINWESDDTSVATVSATGTSVTVTGVAEGTATITARSADDTSVYAECEVTVTEAPAEVVINKDNISNFSNSYAERDWTYGAGANAISGKIKAYKNGDNIQMNSNNSCYIYNTDAIKGYITGITFTKVSGTKALTCYVGTSVISSNPASGGSANTTYTWSFSADDHYTYFRVSTEDSNGGIVSSAITITYQKVQTVDPTGITMDDSSTINMDTYNYGRRRLNATVEPFNANDKTVTWGTSDDSVVTIDNGILTAKGVGTTTVYATTANFVSDILTPELKASVTVRVTEALYKKATFVPTSTSDATQTDDCLPGGSVSLSASSAGSWNDGKSAIQLTSGKDVTFTISGYQGMKISGVDLIVSSNGNAGGGALSVTAGTTNIFTISSATFDDPTWNGAYDSNPCDLYRATTEYVVGSGETVKFSFSATANSLYVHSVAIRYLDYSLEQWCESFLSTITCDGVDSITDDSQWDALGIEFLDLDEDLRNIAAEATANKDSSNVIEQAMARYDLIIRKYGTSAHDDFIGRFGEGKINGPLNSSSAILGNIVGNPNTVAIVVVVAIILVTCIGGYFFLRKRKEN